MKEFEMKITEVKTKVMSNNRSYKKAIVTIERKVQQIEKF